MRVFVIGTGRCGSVTFSKACEHITNFTVGHETGCPDLAYPDNHIEVNTQLRACITQLRIRYRDSFFVHLTRDRVDCVESLAALSHGETMAAYQRLHQSIIPEADALSVARKFYEWENNAIAWELSSSGVRSMMFRIDERDRERDWQTFWDTIRAKGNQHDGLMTLSIRHNTRADRGEA